MSELENTDFVEPHIVTNDELPEAEKLKTEEAPITDIAEVFVEEAQQTILEKQLQKAISESLSKKIINRAVKKAIEKTVRKALRKIIEAAVEEAIKKLTHQKEDDSLVLTRENIMPDKTTGKKEMMVMSSIKSKDEICPDKTGAAISSACKKTPKNPPKKPR